MKLYLIRHAEADGNLYRVAQGQDDSSVTDRGLRQIAALERRFEGVVFCGSTPHWRAYSICIRSCSSCMLRTVPLSLVYLRASSS